MTLHTENGMLGMGPVAPRDRIAPDHLNAGNVPLNEPAGPAYSHQADSLVMMRGGRVSRIDTDLPAELRTLCASEAGRRHLAEGYTGWGSITTSIKE